MLGHRNITFALSDDNLVRLTEIEFLAIYVTLDFGEQWGKRVTARAKGAKMHSLK